MSVEEFRNFLKDHREVKLMHNNTRYKAKTVTEVLYRHATEKGCVGCHDRFECQYVVKCGEIYFYVSFVADCECDYDEEHQVISCTTNEDLKACLLKEDKNVFKALYPDEYKEESTVEESDSY